MQTIQAVFENGVFRPTMAVNLPEQTVVEFEPRVQGSNDVKGAEQSSPAPMSEGLARIYEILGERYDSGYTDTAARHNEHQP